MNTSKMRIVSESLEMAAGTLVASICPLSSRLRSRTMSIKVLTENNALRRAKHWNR